MDPEALQLASRFSLPPNSLGFCGRNTAPDKLIDCVTKGNCCGIENELGKFIVLNPYLETISAITRLKKFSYPVVEAYWLGNDSLQKAKPEHYHLLLKKFAGQGIPSWLIDELKLRKPKIFIPFHLFQVLHVGVGRITSSVPFNLETINHCMIRWGKVMNLTKSRIMVELNSLTKKGHKYGLTTLTGTFPYHPGFLPGLSRQSIVAVHWKQVIKILNPRETENLTHWTKETLVSL